MTQMRNDDIKLRNVRADRGMKKNNITKSQCDCKL